MGLALMFLLISVPSDMSTVSGERAPLLCAVLVAIMNRYGQEAGKRTSDILKQDTALFKQKTTSKIADALGRARNDHRKWVKEMLISLIDTPVGAEKNATNTMCAMLGATKTAPAAQWGKDHVVTDEIEKGSRLFPVNRTDEPVFNTENRNMVPYATAIGELHALKARGP